MTTFDQTLDIVSTLLTHEAELVSRLQPLIINRDLNGRIRLIIRAEVQQEAENLSGLNKLVEVLANQLAPHAFPAEHMVIFEDDLSDARAGARCFALEGLDGVTLIDRLASEDRWASISEESKKAPRVVFFSIKGGVGRSTAMAMSAWSLAQAGKRVMVLDMDLESPGLSSALLPAERRPAYGITDWLVEDLVNNGDAVFDDMVATSELSHDGEIYVVPAHGAEPGDYISKLGRVWMPKVNSQGQQENWSQRLNRLLQQLEERWQPDVILIDARSGLDEVASSCVTDLGAKLVLLFAIEGEQTWSGYRILFEYWRKTGVVHEIRERLQIIGAMIPDIGDKAYMSELIEHSGDLFAESLYDEVPAGDTTDELWSFDDKDEGAPHYPWPIRWHRGFAALSSLHSHLQQIDPQQAQSIYGTLLEQLAIVTEPQDGTHE